jgi:hypothetical protein
VQRKGKSKAPWKMMQVELQILFNHYLAIKDSPKRAATLQNAPAGFLLIDP